MAVAVLFSLLKESARLMGNNLGPQIVSSLAFSAFPVFSFSCYIVESTTYLCFINRHVTDRSSKMNNSVFIKINSLKKNSFMLKPSLVSWLGLWLATATVIWDETVFNHSQPC